jgi:hypothetical protein
MLTRTAVAIHCTVPQLVDDDVHGMLTAIRKGDIFTIFILYRRNKLIEIPFKIKKRIGILLAKYT